jgi:hypothetical protein
VSRPDEVNPLPDGRREEITYRKSPGRPGYRSRRRKIIGPDGRTDEVWHEVLDAQGNFVHQHLKYERGERDAGTG